ncbi:MAG TPA: transposase, partial [Sphingomicrobium sp.]
ATYYNWRKKYGGLMPSEMKRLKQLEEENQRLRGSSPTWPSTRRCCRTSSAAKYEACPEA